MTDTDESQASGSDYLDAQELICSGQKELYKVHSRERNKQITCSWSRQKNAAPEESSDEPSSVCGSDTSTEVLLDSSDSEIDLSTTSGSKNHPESSTALSEQQTESVVGVLSNDSSSDSSLSPPRPVKASETSEKPKSKLNLKAIFAYHFRGKRFKAAAHRNFRCRSGKRRRKKNEMPSYESTRMPLPTGRPPLTASPEEQRRRLQHRGVQFPFVEKYYGKKHIPMRMVLQYEHAAIKGYLQYVEMLKYEEHLKKALKTLQANEDLEREGLAVRKHKYLDDEGPISPIQEMNDDGDNLSSDNPEDFDARVVENSSFIISSKIPNKKKSKPERKRVKSVQTVEVEDEDNCC